MPCSIAVTNDALVYWGLANAVTHDATTFETWNQAQVDALIAVLNSETANDFNPAGYFFDNGLADPDTYAWLVVPNNFSDPLKECGIQFALGAGVTPEGNVKARNWVSVNGTIPTTQDAVLWNGYDGSQVASGWKYSLATVGGVSYRFYVFRQAAISEVDGNLFYPTGDFNELNRTSNFQTLICLGVSVPSTLYMNMSLSLPADTSYDVTRRTCYNDFQALQSNLTMVKLGADDSQTPVAFAFDLTGFSGPFGTTLNGDIGNLEFRLFVTPAASQTATTIYWGFAAAATYDPSDFFSWDDTKIANFLTALGNSQAGPYSATPYAFATAPANSVAWIVVPSSYDDFADTTGLVADVLSGNANVNSPDYPNSIQANPGASGVDVLTVNGYITAQTSDYLRADYSWGDDTVFTSYAGSYNGWTWFSRDINGQSYRFYPFLPLYMDGGSANTRSRYWNDGTTPDAFDLTVTT